MDTILEQTPPAVGDVRVILRRWKAGTRTIIALLPDKGTQYGTCKAFELTYGRRLKNVDYRAVITKTMVVDNRDQDAVDLLAELTSWGVNPKVMIRWTPPMVREVTANMTAA
jgi:hypothetical protein